MRPLAEGDPTHVGPYRVLAELGRGGMGRVFLANSPDGRLVAVKVVRDVHVEEDGFRERFRREVAASRRVSGACSAAVLDADADAPTPWLASAFVAGPSLHEAVAGGGPLSEQAVLRLAAGLVTALTEIHRAGLVHRDLTPANVLLTEDGPRVIDFGIARAVETDAGASRLTHTGWLVGSPAYMSPEQVDGREVTPASDVFSLGSVLVMACTGVSPFTGTSPSRTLYQVAHAEPDLSAVPPNVRPIVAACLAKVPGDRPDLDRLRTMIGEVAASARPWPDAVHRLIANQRAEIVRVLDHVDGQTATLTAGPRPVAATRLQPGLPDHAPDQLTAPVAADSRTGRRGLLLGLLAALAAVLVVVVVVTWPRTESSGRADTVADTAADTASDTATTTTPSDDEPVGPDSWDHAGEDKTPFTEEALLPERFTDDKRIEFARVDGGARQCHESAFGRGPLPSSEVISALTGFGCDQVMTGVYLEQPGPYATPDNPVIVSVHVFPLPDSDKAIEMYDYLQGPSGARWNLTTWCTDSGLGSKPCAPGSNSGLRVEGNGWAGRYVIAAMAQRTDGSNDQTIEPWLDSAAREAVSTSGPQNHTG